MKAIASAARTHKDEEIDINELPPWQDVNPRVESPAATLDRSRATREWIDERLTTAHVELREVVESGLQRMLRIQAAFSSTGLDAQDPKRLLAELASLKDPKVYTDIMTLVGELGWRMREWERDQMLRASQLRSSENKAVVSDVVERLKGLDSAGDNAPSPVAGPPVEQPRSA